MAFEGDNMMGVKRTNRSAALTMLHEEGCLSRKKLAEGIKLTPAAITKIVSEFISEGLITEGNSMPASGAGRREVPMTLNVNARYALGMNINLHQVILSAVRLDGTVIFSEDFEIPEEAPAEATIADLSKKLLALAEKNGLERSKILGVGLAIRGITSMDGRTALNSFRALESGEQPIADYAEKYTGFPVVCSNNVRALFAAQLFMSRDKNIHSEFFLRCEYGIGASLYIDDKIWQGGMGQCSEIGHIPVIRRGGKPCSCGKSGCLETVASPIAILEDALSVLSHENTPILWNMSRKSSVESITLDDVLTAAANGDSGCAEIVDRAVRALASALKSVIYIVDPEKIVLYGRMFENRYYLSRLYAEMNEGVDSVHLINFEKSAFNRKLENKAAGLLMIEKFFENGGMPYGNP